MTALFGPGLGTKPTPPDILTANTNVIATIYDGAFKRVFFGLVLLREYERLCTDIRSRESANEKILGLGFTLIGLGATAGIYQKVEPIFFVLPIAVVGIISYASKTGCQSARSRQSYSSDPNGCGRSSTQGGVWTFLLP